MDVTRPIVEVDGITVRYPGQEGAVLERLSLRVAKGQMLTILGPNGAGKSTLLKVITGLLRPDKGRVRIAGDDIFSLSMAERARRLALVSQVEGSAFALSVEETVLTGRAAHLGMLGRPGAKDHALAAGAMEAVGIKHLAQRSLSELSGGQRQLVRIARSLAQGSAILILDEPTAYLDLANQMMVLRAILRLLAGGRTVISTSHDPAHATACGGEVLLLAPEGQSRIGPVADIFDTADLSAFYCAPLLRIETSSGPVILPDYSGLKPTAADSSEEIR